MSKVYLWSGIFSGVLAVVLYFLLQPAKSKKQVIKYTTTNYIDLSDEEIKQKEEVNKPKKSLPATKSKDNLKVIKGIGPKIETLLNENGISTFEDLSLVNIENLKTILLENNLRLANPETWPEDAKQFIK